MSVLLCKTTWYHVTDECIIIFIAVRLRTLTFIYVSVHRYLTVRCYINYGFENVLLNYS
jgi:hypothetical protein